jgi:hypothetical protein
VPSRQRSGEEEANSEKSADDEERQKRLGQMAEEAAKKLVQNLTGNRKLSIRKPPLY